MITDYFLRLISEDIFKHQTDTTIPYYYYIGLSSTAPTIDGKNVTEPTPNEYARVKIDNQDSFGQVDEHGFVSNSKVFYFPEARTNWGTYSHYVIYDTPKDGNLLMYGQLNTPVTIPANAVLTVPVGVLKISTGNM